ncbi:MAG: sodium:proline symporter [Gammaproteobacteria bacterium]|nr:sodium:proline symporter [Gammaproteobacteria bacterium]
MMETILFAIVGIIALISIMLLPKVCTENSFFSGLSPDGRQPSVVTLTFSQVTTWIFARSLMNAAILGYYYGIWGTLAYAGYYFSFLTGWKIIEVIRFKQGFASLHAFLQKRFGRVGVSCYNAVVIIRLISEVFANLLVVGILFGVAGSNLYSIAIVGFSAVVLFYSMLGGLHASLKTDVFQMSMFIVVLSLLLLSVFDNGQFSLVDLNFIGFEIGQPGPVLLLVALLQIWSYPMHDPVMMDRGFLANRDTTKKSFIHAAWISIVCIIVFGCLGVLAGANALEGEDMNVVLMRMLGEWPMLLLSLTLIVSAMSTLDSSLSSASKLIVLDMKLISHSVLNGRLVMLVFMMLGVLCVFWGNKDLFSAVAVSGTASLFLAPVVFFSIFAGKDNVPVWSLLVSFVLSILGATIYFLESSGYSAWLGDIHKYTKLLYISVFVLLTGCCAFWLGIKTNRLSAW